VAISTNAIPVPSAPSGTITAAALHDHEEPDRCKIPKGTTTTSAAHWARSRTGRLP
jgi:hypothetical protein